MHSGAAEVILILIHDEHYGCHPEPEESECVCVRPSIFGATLCDSVTYGERRPNVFLSCETGGFKRGSTKHRDFFEY